MKKMNVFKYLAGALLAPVLVVGCIVLYGTNNEATQDLTSAVQDQYIENTQATNDAQIIAEPQAAEITESAPAQQAAVEAAAPIAADTNIPQANNAADNAEAAVPETEEAKPHNFFSFLNFDFSSLFNNISSAAAKIPFLGDFLKTDTPNEDDNKIPSLSSSNANLSSNGMLGSSIDTYKLVASNYLTEDKYFVFDVYKSPTEGEGNVAFLKGLSSGIKQNEEFINDHKLHIPISVSGGSYPFTEINTYNVHAIKSGAFAGNRYFGEEYEADYYRNYINEIVIDGYKWNEERQKYEGGWFKHIMSTAFQSYYEYTAQTSCRLESITLPDCLIDTAAMTFNNDVTLKTIYTQKLVDNEIVLVNGELPSQLTNICENMFSTCTSLEFNNGTLTIPKNVTSIGYGAFDENVKIDNIDFSQCTALAEIKNQAFRGCSGITNLALPDTVTDLGDEAFQDCYNILYLRLSEKTHSIGARCFSNTTSGAADSTATKFQYLYIPESVKTIGIGAFVNQQNLKELVIGCEEVSSTIGSCAFANCPSIVSITFLWNAPWSMQTDTFVYNAAHIGGDPIVPSICSVTPALDIRFRPLTVEAGDYGQKNPKRGEYNYWMLPYWYGNIEGTAMLDAIFPANSSLSITAAFCNEKYGHDLEKYLEEKKFALYDHGNYDPSSTYSDITTGIYDNETLAAYNKKLKNGVHYSIGISIPDTLEIKDDTGSWKTDNVMKMRTYGQTNTSLESGSTGTGSKTIFFIYNNTQIVQAAAPDGRDIDDGILKLNKNAIQVCGLDQSASGINGCNTLNIEYMDKTTDGATKPNVCITGHTARVWPPKPSNLLSDSNMLLASGDELVENPVSAPGLIGDDDDEEQSGLLMGSNSSSNEEMPIEEACCIFCKPFAALNISDITFGDIKKAEPAEGFLNTCILGCVYNAGHMRMNNTYITNAKSTFTGERMEVDPLGGSCLFNWGEAAAEYTFNHYKQDMSGETEALPSGVYDSEFVNSEANHDGGGVLNAYHLLLDTCTISNNKCGIFGAGLYNNARTYQKLEDGKPVKEVQPGLTTVRDCVITNNASAYAGGGVMNKNSGKDGDSCITFENKNGETTISGNTDTHNQFDSDIDANPSDICIGLDLDQAEPVTCTIDSSAKFATSPIYLQLYTSNIIIDDLVKAGKANLLTGVSSLAQYAWYACSGPNGSSFDGYDLKLDSKTVSLDHAAKLATKFDAGDGSWAGTSGEEIKIKIVSETVGTDEDPAAYTFPEEPTLEGYTFAGWYIGKTRIDDPENPAYVTWSRPKKAVAKWEPEEPEMSLLVQSDYYKDNMSLKDSKLVATINNWLEMMATHER